MSVRTHRTALPRSMKTQVAMGHAMRPEQPNPQTTGPPGLGDPSETVPEEVLELWASLPRHERQRSRRRYFRDQGARCSYPVFSSLLSTIDIRIQNIERTLAEFLHATAASIPVPPVRSCAKSAHEDAGPPPSPAPVNIINGTLPGNPPAAEPARNAVSPSHTVIDSPSPAIPDPTPPPALPMSRWPSRLSSRLQPRYLHGRSRRRDHTPGWR